jgi:hypothetical protein
VSPLDPAGSAWSAGLAVALALLALPRSGTGRLQRLQVPAPVVRPWRRIRRRAGDSVPVPLVLDLVAAVLEAGAPPAIAVGTVAGCLELAGDPGAAALRAILAPGAGTQPGAGSSPVADPGLSALSEALQLAAATGVAPTSLVRAAARRERRRRAAAQAIAARRLAVTIVLPMAACLLPAFMLLTIVPVVLDLLQAL